MASSPSLCVFCGSSPGNDDAYTNLATDLATEMAQEKVRLVYGGGQKGLMGTLANAVLSNDGSVLGVIPSVMASSAPAGHPTQKTPVTARAAPAVSQEGTGSSKIDPNEVATHPAMETRVVDTMHERKALMAKETTEGFIGLPGGYGTFEEVLEIVTWSQLGIHNMPVVLPNILNFWGPLQELLESAGRNGFITPQGLQLIHFIQPQEVESQFGGNWGKAILSSVKAMQERLKGRQGYWKWDQDGEPQRQDFSGQPTAIEVTNLTYSFQPHLEPSLHDINLILPQASRTLLIGANGAGKSTLLRLLAGKRLVSNRKDKTPVKVFDKDVFNAPPAGITYLGTEWAMNPVVRSDIVVEDFLNSVGGYRYKERRDRLLDLLDVDLQWHMHSISDGERRRVQLCMGLMSPWTVLLLDEVTVDLDVQVRSDLLAFLKEETEQRGATIVYATHIFDGLHDFPSHVVHMRLGAIVDESENAKGQGLAATAQDSAMLWPPSSTDLARLTEGSKDKKDGLLLTIALNWLRKDRGIREAEEKGKRGAPKKGGDGMDVETDSER